MNLPSFLTTDSHRLVHLYGHRVTLEDVMHFYEEGFSPEMITGQFPTVPLATIYKTIAFYLDHREGVDAYLRRERDDMDRLRTNSPAAPTLAELQQRLEKVRQSETA